VVHAECLPAADQPTMRCCAACCAASRRRWAGPGMRGIRS